MSKKQPKIKKCSRWTAVLGHSKNVPVRGKSGPKRPTETKVERKDRG